MYGLKPVPFSLASPLQVFEGDGLQAVRHAAI
jgi:hypothetical protein